MKRKVIMAGLLLSFATALEAASADKFLELGRQLLTGELEGVENTSNDEVIANVPIHDPVASPLDELAKDDIRKAVTISEQVGMVVGGAAGLYVCEKEIEACGDSTLSLATAAIVGGFFGKIGGGQVGKIIGQRISDRRVQYTTESEYLDSEIAASEIAIGVREREIAATKIQIEQNSVRIRELSARAALTEQELLEAKNLKMELEGQVEINNKLLEQYNDKILYLNDALSTSESESIAKQEDVALWQKKYDKLLEKRNSLENQKEVIDNQNIHLLTDQKVLDDILG